MGDLHLFAWIIYTLQRNILRLEIFLFKTKKTPLMQQGSLSLVLLDAHNAKYHLFSPGFQIFPESVPPAYLLLHMALYQSSQNSYEKFPLRCDQSQRYKRRQYHK